MAVRKYTTTFAIRTDGTKADGHNRNMTNETIRLRPARQSDAPEIARLVMMAMTDECCRHFYGEGHTAEEFHKLMTALAGRDDTQYSYANTICAVDGHDNIAGVSVSYDGCLLRRLRQPFIDGALRAFGRDFSHISEETSAGELYLDSLAVKPEYRGKGIAQMLIQATADKARQTGAGSLGLLVDYGNPNAERLYIKVGFRQVGVSDWGGHRMKHLQME